MIRITIPPGWTIDRAVDLAIKTAKEARCLVEFTFNGTDVMVDGGADPNVVLNDWSARYLKRSA